MIVGLMIIMINLILKEKNISDEKIKANAGENLARMMEEKDLQGIDVATSIGTSRGYVSKLCHGNGSIDAVKLYRIYTEFGTTPNRIILGEEVEDSYSKEYIYNHPEFILDVASGKSDKDKMNFFTDLISACSKGISQLNNRE